jgi:predicted histone-like DNA-binding protein
MRNIEFDIYENPKAKKENVSYHVRVVHSDLVEFDAIKEQIHKESTASEGDVSLITEQLSKAITRVLSSGDRIHIEGIGYFSLAIEAEGKRSSKINAQKVKMKGIHFRADKTLLDSFEALSFVRTPYKNHSSKVDYKRLQATMKQHFHHHKSITRTEYQELLGLTCSTAQRQLRELCKKPYAIFRREGAKNSPIYVPFEGSRFWE